MCIYVRIHTPILSRERSRPSLRLLSTVPGDARDSSPRGLNTPRMHHVPPRALPTTVLYAAPSRPLRQPSLPLHTPSPLLISDIAGISEGYAYVYSVYTYAEQISLDELPANTPAPSWSDSIQFRRLSSAFSASPSARSRFFFFSVSLSPDLHDPVSPRGTIDPRLTLHGAVFLNSIYDACLFSFFLSSGFPPVFFLSSRRTGGRSSPTQA